MKTNFVHLVPRVSALTLLSLVGTLTQAQVYKCETESGAVLYQNMPGRHCRPMDLPQANVIPAPRLPVAATRVSNHAAPSSASAPIAGSQTASVGFPKVDGQTQKARDTDRKRIIEDEWKKEKSKLSDLEREFNGGAPERRGDERNAAKYEERIAKMRDEVNRTKANVDSLERELRSIN